MSSTKNSIVSIKNVTKTYFTDIEELTVLKNASLEVPQGSRIVIVGESGSGKSTLLNIVGGIDTVTEGSVTAGKWDVTKLKEKELSEYRSTFLGLIFQFHYLLKDFTALENVYMPALIAGVPKKEAIERAKQLLNDVGVIERMNHLPSQLSGGERQRVAAARALVNDPTLILADEPTGNLDPANAEMIGNLLFDMVDKYNKTLFMVTHDINLAKKGGRCFKIINKRLEETKL